jgi:hypothetical protein
MMKCACDECPIRIKCYVFNKKGYTDGLEREAFWNIVGCPMVEKETRK